MFQNINIFVSQVKMEVALFAHEHILMHKFSIDFEYVHKSGK